MNQTPSREKSWDDAALRVKTRLLLDAASDWTGDPEKVKACSEYCTGKSAQSVYHGGVWSDRVGVEKGLKIGV